MVGGEELKPYQFPWLGQIIIKNEPAIEATLISDRYVITSAITVYGYNCQPSYFYLINNNEILN